MLVFNTGFEEGGLSDLNPEPWDAWVTVNNDSELGVASGVACSGSLGLRSYSAYEGAYSYLEKDLEPPTNGLALSFKIYVEACPDTGEQEQVFTVDDLLVVSPHYSAGTAKLRVFTRSSGQDVDVTPGWHEVKAVGTYVVTSGTSIHWLFNWFVDGVLVASVADVDDDIQYGKTLKMGLLGQGYGYTCETWFDDLKVGETASDLEDTPAIMLQTQLYSSALSLTSVSGGLSFAVTENWLPLEGC